jgi:hypothetical protein
MGLSVLDPRAALLRFMRCQFPWGWGLTNGRRHELRAQATRVVGLPAGFIDTDLTRGLNVPKATVASRSMKYRFDPPLIQHGDTRK